MDKVSDAASPNPGYAIICWEEVSGLSIAYKQVQPLLLLTMVNLNQAIQHATVSCILDMQCLSTLTTSFNLQILPCTDATNQPTCNADQ